MKVVINKCYGGYSLSKEAYEFLGLEWDDLGYRYCYDRADEKLVRCVETLGEAANGIYADLKIVEIPDDVDWEIEDYDGIERIVEVHRAWE